MADTAAFETGHASESRRPREAAGLDGWNLSLGRVLGIKVHAHWSLLLIFALVVSNLGFGLFPYWHPEWSLALIWALAFGAAVLFFGSILAHEMSHSLVARRYGIEVRSITLFVFGGVSHMEADSSSPRVEFTVAIAGPLMSLAIGITSIAAASLGIEAPVSMAVLETAGPLTSLLLWLGPVNILLGVFNLAPGFPLDGGRVFRSVVWWVTDDVLKATRWASAAGRLFAGSLMALGLLSALNGMTVQGVWFLLIGWFLYQAAGLGYQQQVLQSALEGIPVSRIMQTGVVTVPPELPLAKFIERHLLARDQSVYPVVSAGVLVGIVSAESVNRVPRSERERKTIESVMIRRERLPTSRPDTAAVDAIRQLSGRDDFPMPVIDNGEFVGLLRQQDIVRWAALHS